jgi:hypothetical protein
MIGYRMLLTSVMTAMLLSLYSCSNNNPMESPAGDTTGLNFVDVTIDAPALDKGGDPGMLATERAWISKKDGGLLRYVRRGIHVKDRIARVILEVLPDGVDESLEISLALEKGIFFGTIGMQYAPHGLVFNKPAILNIRAENLDLSALDAATIDKLQLYYDNRVTGKWELMQCDKIVIDIEAGILRVVNGRLPHFSRYALAWSN